MVTLDQDTDGFKIRSWDPTASPDFATYVNEWNWTDGDPMGPVPAVCCLDAIGHDYTIIAQSQSDGTAILFGYDGGTSGSPVFPPTPLTPIPTLTPVDLGDLAAVASLGGSAILAGVVASLDGAGNPSLPVIDTSGFFAPIGTVLGALQVANGDALCAGIATLDGDPVAFRTWYMSRAVPRVYQHSNVFEAGSYWAQAAYRDSGTGHETLPGPMAQVTKIPGSQLTFSMADLPPGVDGVDIFFGKGSSPPANVDMWSQGVSSGGNVHLTVFEVLQSGTNPLTVATLTGTATSELQDDAGVAQIRSDGTGHIYDLIAAGGGGGGTGGIDIDCGGFTTTGVEIDCGGF
jgi:hypothetical protein